LEIPIELIGHEKGRTMVKFFRKAGVVAVAAALGAVSTSAWAGGFAIGTQSGSGTGNAFAGGAAVADDASVAWSNPAGMTFLPPGKQIAGALHVLKPSFKFRNEGSTGLYAAPGTGDGGDGGDWAFVPNGFFTMELNPRVRLGVALNAPFGLKTEYDSGWRGQLTALTSEIKTVNINPSLAYKISDTVSVGGGLNIQWVEAELSNFAGAAGVAKLKADDIGYGFNLGILAAVGPSTRIGAHYRSRIKYEVEGDATFSAAAVANGNIRADIRVPESFSISLFHVLNPKWELMADITRTGWDSLEQLTVVRTSGPLAGATLTSLMFRWDDTMRYGIGANYRWSDQTKLRFGVAFDETPTNDVDRTARLPDQDRKWLAFGVQHRVSKAGVLEIGYAHEFIKDARVRNDVPGFTGCAAGCLQGSFENKADILSVQYSHSF
jgi:long-chain fatty acid transport protein